MKKINLLGYSGHSYVIADTILSNQCLINGYYDLEETKTNPYQIKYLGNELLTENFHAKDEIYYFPSVGSNSLRKKIVDFLESKNLPQTTICHSTAKISPNAKLELSCFIGINSVINTFSVIKKGSIINTAAIIEHECIIGEFCHIAPGAILTGNIIIGNNTFIGANSIIIQGKKIGNNVIIGAGSVVISDIPDNETWAGNPARKIN